MDKNNRTRRLFDWLGRLAQVVAAPALAIALWKWWLAIVANPFLFLLFGMSLGVSTLWFLMLYTRGGVHWTKRGRALRGMVRNLEELEALRDDLERMIATGKVTARKRRQRVLRAIWRMGHVLESYGVQHPNADDPGFSEWYGFLVTLTHYTRERDGARIVELLDLKAKQQA